jgi:hypothetical protein
MIKNTGEQNSKKFPKLEMLLATGDGDENEKDLISEKDLPTLTVIYDGERYSIVRGGELIENALAKSFQNLENDFYTVWLAYVDLRQFEANSKNMKPIRLTKHAQEQCIERGTNEVEILEAVRTGTRKLAKQGRYQYQANFQYNAEWQGKFYAIKRVVPIVSETDRELIVITVYTFYF